MALIEIRNLSKVVKTDQHEIKTILSSINISFPASGLVTIIGKSGSGKSTLLNLMSLFDNPSEGHIYFEGKDITKYSIKQKEKFRNSKIGVVFQHYNLLERQTALYNVMLPLLIKGMSAKKAKKLAIEKFKEIKFPEKLFEHKCCDLSGGEKQRVAFCRALINQPRILLCDEPTGDLDSRNGDKVMSLLKEVSKSKLVIIVSHNDKQMKEYSDRVISIKDGRIVKDEIIHKVNSVSKKEEHHIKGKNKGWISFLSQTNFKSRLKRNILSIISLVVGLTSTLLIAGFSNGAPSSIAKASERQFDYGSLTLSKEFSETIKDSGVSIVQVSRPSLEELESIKVRLNNYEITNNYDSLVPMGVPIYIGNEMLEDLLYEPIFSFEGDYVDSSLLIKGYFPGSDNLNEVVINKKAHSYLKGKLGFDPLNVYLNIKHHYENKYYTHDEYEPVIVDHFVYEKEIHIVGVVDELNYLATPKMYYPIVALEDYLINTAMNNLSTYIGESISWFSIVDKATSYETITSYSYRVFAKDVRDKELIRQTIDEMPEPYNLYSPAITVGDSLRDLIKAATLGMDIYLFIAILGTVLILGIVSFSSYTEDRKSSAILSSLGASKDSINDVYINENLLIGAISTAFSLAFAPILQWLLNLIIKQTIDFESIINIPFTKFMNIPFLLPLLIVGITTLVSLFSTYLPIAFSKKISIREELVDE